MKKGLIYSASKSRKIAKILKSMGKSKGAIDSASERGKTIKLFEAIGRPVRGVYVEDALVTCRFFKNGKRVCTSLTTLDQMPSLTFGDEEVVIFVGKEDKRTPHLTNSEEEKLLEESRTNVKVRKERERRMVLRRRAAETFRKTKVLGRRAKG